MANPVRCRSSTWHLNVGYSPRSSSELSSDFLPHTFSNLSHCRGFKYDLYADGVPNFYPNPNFSSKVLIWKPTLYLIFPCGILISVLHVTLMSPPNLLLLQISHFSKENHLLPSCTNKKSGHHPWLISTSFLTAACQSHLQNKPHIYPIFLQVRVYQTINNSSNVLIFYKSLLTYLFPPVYSSQSCQRTLLENTLDYIKTPNSNLFTKTSSKSKLLTRTYKTQHTLASVTLSFRLYNHRKFCPTLGT